MVAHRNLFVAASLLLAGDGLANVGYFAGSGHDIVLAATAEVQMVSEDVTLNVRPDAAEFLCRFELRNLTDHAVELQAGFPLNSDWYEGWGHRRVEPDSFTCEDPEALVVAEIFRFIARDDDTTYHVRYVRHDAEQKYKHLFLWTMTFAPHETRTLHVSYDVPASETLFSSLRSDWDILTGQAEGVLGEHSFGSAAEDVIKQSWLWIASLHWYSYVTETGASWAGDIERADFHVRYGLADGILRESIQKQAAEATELPPYPLLTWLCLSPPGAVVPVDERSKDAYASLGLEWEPQPLPCAQDWHFEPFAPGPMVAIGWLTMFLPATAEGVRVLLQVPDPYGMGTAADSPQLLRAAIAGWHGVAPADEAMRRVLEPFVWYEPVAGRSEAELAAEVQAQLAVIDEFIAGRDAPASPPAPDESP
jgi:hypothetical protein